MANSGQICGYFESNLLVRKESLTVAVFSASSTRLPTFEVTVFLREYGLFLDLALGILRFSSLSIEVP